MIEIGETAKDVNAFFKKWHDLSEADRIEVIKDLKSKGKLSVKIQHESEIAFTCPIYGFGLVKPCSLGKCQYYIKYDNSSSKQTDIITTYKSCLIYCMDMSKNGRLSAQEVANVLGSSVSEINNTNAMSIAKIKRQKIKETLEKYQIPKFQYIEGHCIYCELNIKDELAINAYPDLNLIENFGWCSSECKESMPKWEFFVEREFGCACYDALAIGLMLFKNIDNLGNVFGVSNDILKTNRDKIKEHLKTIKRIYIS